MKEQYRKILMVDDDHEDRSMLKDTFNDLGFGHYLHFEENGEKAIEYLQSCNPENGLPCLIILDLNMPKLNGRQTLQLIKSQPVFNDIIVIIYSTSINPKERDECLALGAHSYVVKPVSYKDSINVANTFLGMCTAIKAH